ncbi:MAG: ABC transporter substrate-binding protein, partial [Phycisphaerales bacterium]
TISGPGNPQLHAYDPGVLPLTADAAAAQALLDGAGWRDRDGDGVREDAQGRPLQFVFVHPNAPASFGELAKYITQRAALAGIRCTPEALPPAQANARLSEGQFDAALFGTTPRDPEADPEAFWHSRRVPPAGSNFARWRSERADGLIDRAVRTLDRGERIKLWHELHAVFAEEQPCTFLRASPTLLFIKRTVGNVKAHNAGIQRAEFFKRAAP